MSRVVESVPGGRDRAGGAVPLVAGLSLPAAAGPLTWWAIGAHDTGDDYLIGPFDLPSWVGSAVVAVGWGSLLLAVAVLAVPGLRRGPRVATWTTVLLTVVAAGAAVAWRVITDGVVGVNLGGVLLLMVGPELAAAVLAGAVLVETRRRALPRRTTLTWVVTVILALTALQSLLWHQAN